MMILLTKGNDSRFLMKPCIIQDKKYPLRIISHHQYSQKGPKSLMITDLRKSIDKMPIRNSDRSKDMLSFLLTQTPNLRLMSHPRPGLKQGGFQSKCCLILKQQNPSLPLEFFLIVDKYDEATSVSISYLPEPTSLLDAGPRTLIDGEFS